MNNFYYYSNKKSSKQIFFTFLYKKFKTFIYFLSHQLLISTSKNYWSNSRWLNRLTNEANASSKKDRIPLKKILAHCFLFSLKKYANLSTWVSPTKFKNSLTLLLFYILPIANQAVPPKTASSTFQLHDFSTQGRSYMEARGGPGPPKPQNFPLKFFFFPKKK
jgi:hypothetical protein